MTTTVGSEQWTVGSGQVDDRWPMVNSTAARYEMTEKCVGMGRGQLRKGGIRFRGSALVSPNSRILDESNGQGTEYER